MTVDRDPLDLLAEDFSARLRRGERPSVADYAAAHPEHAAELRDLLPAVAQIELLKRHRQSLPAERSLPDRFGDYRIVRELGRGGMGVVFEAVQESLGRRVALKVLATHTSMDADRRERFVREAKAAARLHHTHIVPVFGAGEHDGLPYYVMQLIPGRGLNAVVSAWHAAAHADTPAPARADDTWPHAAPTAAPSFEMVLDGPRYDDWRFVATVGVEVADALQYAHDSGVVHRDIKPANLLLDDRGQVWVADFGLAKLDDAGGLTATGHVLGTLQYMAPEGLTGAPDARGDVYGLGATLYELLTLRPPVTGETPAELMKQLADGVPVPPRKVNPAVPRDLETIVLKALAREPERRYATAGDMAADLRAFLDDRPIRARRESLTSRAARWCRRNPAVAGLSLTTAAALLLAAVVGWVAYARTTKALADETAARGDAEHGQKEAKEASEKLEANLRLTLQEFEKVFEAAAGGENRPGFALGFGPMKGFGPKDGFGAKDGFGPKDGPKDGSKDGPMVGEAADRASVLEAVLGFYDKFAERNATQPALQLEAAKAHRRVAELHQWLGRQEKATASFRRSAALLAGLTAEFPDDADVRFERMQLLAHAPPAIVGMPSIADQLAAAVALGAGFTDPPRRWAVGSVELKLGAAREQSNDPVGAAAAYRTAIVHLAAGPGREGRPPVVVFEQAMARRRLAALLAAEGNMPAARRVLEEAVADVRPFGGGGPGRFGGEFPTATLNQLAGVLETMGDYPAAARTRQEIGRMAPGGFPGGPGGGQPRPNPPPKK
ncbi:serine/threonine-protein kinase [Urbifossiella limnaea]|uniref:Serine/threonine-protein kinase PrkC n=1 Tax=Urbifossiella limnaea TaxID=2528023 RepID=A0A517XTU2_9BACT|nr:serine/threonine-protein kinase [Urbifossiella limnaea]QDU20874.1 Serine/threonine-protein kinase PrkC [Urbifossiella limnaea]